MKPEYWGLIQIKLPEIGFWEGKPRYSGFVL
jgi:pyridoxine/pyridoxamine 5'-phosphate oxidase